MPYPNEHSCRLEDPKQFDKFARKKCDRKYEGKCIDVIYGIKSGKSKVQALRYPKEIWSASAARAHCKDLGGTFEPAAEEKSIDPTERRMAAEFRAVEDEDGAKKLVGYAALYNSLSEDLGGFRELIIPGAFDKSLSENDIRMCWNHRTDEVLARTKAGTLKLWSDEKGLGFEASPPQWFLPKLESVERGDIDNMSFAFQIPEGGEEWDKDENGNLIRKLNEIYLKEISPVAFPAYPDTLVAVRSLQRYQEKINASGIAGQNGGTELKKRELELYELKRRLNNET